MAQFSSSRDLSVFSVENRLEGGKRGTERSVRRPQWRPE